jgi:hypothetical protein
VFDRVYKIEIQSAMMVFSTQFCELLPLSPSLWFKYAVFTYIVCKRGGYGILSLR